jgi:photosystem II stability/assembly factor-like uncharacterized protein
MRPVIFAAIFLLFASKHTHAQWTRLTPFFPSSLRIADITESDSGIFAVGYRFSDFQGHILRSFDDGAHWDSLQLPPSGFLFETIASKNADTAFIGGFGSISVWLWTTNGGHDWSYFSVDPNTTGINDMQFLDAQHAFASGYDTIQFNSGSCYYSGDGGATWNQQTVDNGTCLDTIGLDYIQMVDVGTGYAVSNFGLHKYLLKTTDTGRHWNIVYEQPGIGGIWFIDANTGVMVASGGKVYKTGDGGVNWTLKPTPTTQPLFSVAFTDAGTGYAVGGNGTIIKTTNAGETWTLETSPTTQPLFRVRCFGGHAYAVGDGGTVVRSLPPSTALAPDKVLLADVYPNPAENYLTVLPGAGGKPLTLSLIDLMGHVVLQTTANGQKAMIDVRNLPSGNYVLKVSSADQVAAKLISVVHTTP